MIRRPRRSTLFHYTTLFRSRGRSSRQATDPRCRDRGGARSRARRDHHGAQHEQRDDREREEDPARVGDRKSSRLNSSHITISYAVLCLKKKKQKKKNNTELT